MNINTAMPTVWKIFKLTVLGCLQLVTSSCLWFHSDYPESRPKLIESAKSMEDAIQGSYACIGTELKYGTASYLKNVLFRRHEGQTPRNCDYITINKTPSGFNIAVYSGGVPIQEKTLLKDIDYKIDDNWVVLNEFSEFDVWTGVFYAIKRYVLTLNVNKDLVAKLSDNGFGVYIVIPFGGSSIEWSIFNNIDLSQRR